MLLSPEVLVRAITLTHGNTSLEDVRRNAVTIMNVMRDHNAARGITVPYEELPVLAVGRNRYHPCPCGTYTEAEGLQDANVH